MAAGLAAGRDARTDAFLLARPAAGCPGCPRPSFGPPASGHLPDRGAQVRFVIPLPGTGAVGAGPARGCDAVHGAAGRLQGPSIPLQRPGGHRRGLTDRGERDRSELEGLIGLFVNTLVLRTDLAGGPGFRELLGGCGRRAWGRTPTRISVREAGGGAETGTGPSRNPLFQVMFVLQNSPMQPLSLRELTVTPLELERKRDQFDLTLSHAGIGRRPAGGVRIQHRPVRRATIERMAGHFRTLLEAVVADPDRGYRNCRCCPRRSGVRCSSNGTRTVRRIREDDDPPAVRGAGGRGRPEAVALAFEGGAMSYRRAGRPREPARPACLRSWASGRTCWSGVASSDRSRWWWRCSGC